MDTYAVYKILMIIAFAGHALCWYCDRLITCTPNGRFSARALDDNAKLSVLFEGVPSERPMLSLNLGIVSLAMSFCGFMGIYEWLKQFSQVYAVIILISAGAFILFVIPHHIICALIEWLYIREDRTDRAREIILSFFKKTSFTMIVCYVGLLVFSVTFFIAVITGVTSLPRWACIFNTLPLFLILSPFKPVGTGNIANAVMFLALAVLI